MNDVVEWRNCRISWVLDIKQSQAMEWMKKISSHLLEWCCALFKIISSTRESINNSVNSWTCEKQLIFFICLLAIFHNHCAWLWNSPFVAEHRVCFLFLCCFLRIFGLIYNSWHVCKWVDEYVKYGLRSRSDLPMKQSRGFNIWFSFFFSPPPCLILVGGLGW